MRSGPSVVHQTQHDGLDRERGAEIYTRAIFVLEACGAALHAL